MSKENLEEAGKLFAKLEKGDITRELEYLEDEISSIYREIHKLENLINNRIDEVKEEMKKRTNEVSDVGQMVEDKVNRNRSEIEKINERSNKLSKQQMIQQSKISRIKEIGSIKGRLIQTRDRLIRPYYGGRIDIEDSEEEEAEEEEDYGTPRTITDKMKNDEVVKVRTVEDGEPETVYIRPEDVEKDESGRLKPWTEIGTSVDELSRKELCNLEVEHILANEDEDVTITDITEKVISNIPDIVDGVQETTIRNYITQKIDEMNYNGEIDRRIENGSYVIEV